MDTTDQEDTVANGKEERIMDERVNKIQVAMNNEQFADKVAMCNSAEELQSLFASESIEMTVEEVNALIASVKSSEADGAEIGEVDLDNVAGGFWGAVAIIGGAYIAGRLYGTYANSKLGYCWN